MPGDKPTIVDDAVPSWRRRLLDLLEFRPRETVALGVLCIAIVAGAAFAYARSLPKTAPDSIASPIPTADATGSLAPTTSGELFVHITGAVARPGVYRLPAGSRVIDGVTAAGGARAEADLSSINLARPLTDGERVYIPRRGEIPPAATAGGDPTGATGDGGSGGASDKVNINTATVSQLEELPGIGEVIAQRIVDYRTQHGPFKTVRDLLKVEGIGEKKFESIQDYVTV
ncbi:MAG: helix-hairpin-helix domain-containing protein [Actinomycetota bacterium]